MKGEAAVEAEHLELLVPNVKPQPMKLEQERSGAENRGDHLALVLGVLRQLGLDLVGDLGAGSGSFPDLPLLSAQSWVFGVFRLVGQR
jgi:hypothetical protein